MHKNFFFLCRLLFIFLFSYGCTKVIPNPNNVIGEWRSDDGTIINFHSDGKCEVQNISYWAMDENDSRYNPATRISFTGYWEFKSPNKWNDQFSVVINNKIINNPEDLIDTTYIEFAFDIETSNNPKDPILYLYQYIGDPDDGVIFKLINQNRSRVSSICDNLYDYIFTNTENKNVKDSIYWMGKDAIPCLIDFIDMDEKSFVGFQDPYSSSLPSYKMKNYVGIEGAYLIELILSTDSLIPNDSKVWREKIKPYKIFGHGVITKVVNNKPVLEPLELEDMKTIKKIYFQWWQLNKEKSIQLLRKEWKENKRILNDSNFQWI